MEDLNEKLNILIGLAFSGGLLTGVFSVGIVMYHEIKKLKMKAQEVCQHKNTHTYIEDSTPCCETIKITCLDCDKVISLKTDCR
jgi:hypothetical protein